MRLSGVEKAAFFDPNGSVNDTVRFTRAHEDTTMNVREMLGAESADTRGDDYFVGYESVMECCLLYTCPSPRDVEESRMPSSA